MTTSNRLRIKMPDISEQIAGCHSRMYSIIQQSIVSVPIYMCIINPKLAHPVLNLPYQLLNQPVLHTAIILYHQWLNLSIKRYIKGRYLWSMTEKMAKINILNLVFFVLFSSPSSTYLSPFLMEIYGRYIKNAIVRVPTLTMSYLILASPSIIRIT